MTKETTAQKQDQIKDQQAKLAEQLLQLYTDWARLKMAPAMFQIELLEQLIKALSTEESQRKLTSGEFVQVSHQWADWPPNIARKASKEVRTILKRRGFDSNLRIFLPTSGEFGCVLFYVRPKVSWRQLFIEFTQAL